MGIIKILFHGRPPLVRRAPVDAAPKRATPIHSVRRKFLLRGTEYSVTLKPAALRNGLTLQEQTMVVALHPPTRENFEQFMTGWYRRQARQAYEEAISRWLPQFHAAGYPLPPPRLKIFAMRRAWGRCYYTKGLITMNLHLVKAPDPCIDYIILHELCHFVVNNHSREFYRLVEQFLPAWRDADQLLKNFAREKRIIR